MSSDLEYGKGKHAGEHKTVADTARITYERCRESGMGHEAARKISRETAELTHRSVDRRGR